MNRKIFFNPVVIMIVATVAIVVLGVLLFSKTSTGSSASNKKATAGNPAPDFALPSTENQTVTLSSFRGTRNVLIFFHEGLSCDPCMQQMPELEKVTEEFEKMNVEVLYVTFDPVDQSKEAKARFGIKKPILSYNLAKTEVDYDLTNYSMDMGRRAGHTFVLVDLNGQIIWRKDYWPGLGHMVTGGTMFVKSNEIVDEVKKYLDKP
ncbi:MAG: peroxiredoxin family protein [Patescibacteria group bacterium]